MTAFFLSPSFFFDERSRPIYSIDLYRMRILAKKKSHSLNKGDDFLSFVDMKELKHSFIVCNKRLFDEDKIY